MEKLQRCNHKNKIKLMELYLFISHCDRKQIDYIIEDYDEDADPNKEIVIVWTSRKISW